MNIHSITLLHASPRYPSRRGGLRSCFLCFYCLKPFSRVGFITSAIKNAGASIEANCLFRDMSWPG